MEVMFESEIERIQFEVYYKKEKLRELAKQALQIQDACNMSGLAHTFAAVARDLLRLTGNTDRANQHPIAKVWISKMQSLCDGEPDSFDWKMVHEMTEDR